jgi:hypothetical protein
MPNIRSIVPSSLRSSGGTRLIVQTPFGFLAGAIVPSNERWASILEGHANAVGFRGEAKVSWIAVERGQIAGLGDRDRSEILNLQQLVPEALCVYADCLELHARTSGFGRQHFDWLGPVRTLEGRAIRKLLDDFVVGHVATCRTAVLGEFCARQTAGHIRRGPW